MLPHNKQVKQQIEQCTCINKPVNTEILIQKYNVNLSSKGNNVTVEKKKKKIRSQTISLVNQAFASKYIVSNIQGSGNRLPGNVIDYQKTILKISF